MKATVLIFFVMLTCGCSGIQGPGNAIPVSHETRVDLLAYYYPWYTEDDWSRHPYVGRPVLGEYGTGDPAVAAQHIAWCADAGIDGLCVSWWGEGSQTDRHLRAGLLAADNAGDIVFCIYYESLKLDGLDGERNTSVDFVHPAVLEQLIADFRYLAEQYFERDDYYRINGRPVVGLYVTRTFRNFTTEHTALLREAVGVDVFLIGDEVYFGGQASPDTAVNGPGVFDAYSAYNMHTDPRINDGETAWAYLKREAWPVYENWVADDRVWFMPKVMPSYEDFRGHDTLAGSGEDFEAMLAAAGELATNDPAASHGVMFITSFNEWWEGSTIEPAEEYGTGYLDAVRCWRDAE